MYTGEIEGHGGSLPFYLVVETTKRDCLEKSRDGLRCHRSTQKPQAAMEGEKEGTGDTRAVGVVGTPLHSIMGSTGTKRAESAVMQQKSPD